MLVLMPQATPLLLLLLLLLVMLMQALLSQHHELEPSAAARCHICASCPSFCPASRGRTIHVSTSTAGRSTHTARASTRKRHGRRADAPVMVEAPLRP
jgi:hypothetical protein